MKKKKKKKNKKPDTFDNTLEKDQPDWYKRIKKEEK